MSPFPRLSVPALLPGFASVVMTPERCSHGSTRRIFRYPPRLGRLPTSSPCSWQGQALMQCCLLSSFRFSRTAQCRICYSIRYRRQICNNIHKICIFALYKAGLTGDFVQIAGRDVPLQTKKAAPPQGGTAWQIPGQTVLILRQSPFFQRTRKMAPRRFSSRAKASHMPGRPQFSTMPKM